MTSNEDATSNTNTSATSKPGSTGVSSSDSNAVSTSKKRRQKRHKKAEQANNATIAAKSDTNSSSPKAPSETKTSSKQQNNPETTAASTISPSTQTQLIHKQQKNKNQEQEQEQSDTKKRAVSPTAPSSSPKGPSEAQTNAKHANSENGNSADQDERFTVNRGQNKRGIDSDVGAVPAQDPSLAKVENSKANSIDSNLSNMMELLKVDQRIDGKFVNKAPVEMKPFQKAEENPTGDALHAILFRPDSKFNSKQADAIKNSMDDLLKVDKAITQSRKHNEKLLAIKSQTKNMNPKIDSQKSYELSTNISHSSISGQSSNSEKTGPMLSQSHPYSDVSQYSSRTGSTVLASNTSTYSDDNDKDKICQVDVSNKDASTATRSIIGDHKPYGNRAFVSMEGHDDREEDLRRKNDCECSFCVIC